MATNSKEVALRKRQQIDSSKKTMFIAVAIAAFVTGIALVVSFFLIQQIAFRTRVISAKQSTLSTVRDNIEIIDELKDNVRALDANEALNHVKIKEDSSALQTILDALPAEPNADALGASLQVKFTGLVSGVTISNLSVESVDSGLSDDYTEVVDSESLTSGASESDESSSSPSINFSMTVSGAPEGLRELLTRFERSIRVIDLSLITIEANATEVQMILAGRAYYEPGKEVKLGERVIMP